jgi:hypothetical protein
MKTKKKFKFKIGESTKDIWCGDLVTECEFLADLGQGQMLFYDIKGKSFRRVYIAVNEDDGEPYMDGWNCAKKPSELI